MSPSTKKNTTPKATPGGSARAPKNAAEQGATVAGVISGDGTTPPRTKEKAAGKKKVQANATIADDRLLSDGMQTRRKTGKSTPKAPNKDATVDPLPRRAPIARVPAAPKDNNIALLALRT